MICILKTAHMLYPKPKTQTLNRNYTLATIPRKPVAYTRTKTVFVVNATPDVYEPSGNSIDPRTKTIKAPPCRSPSEKRREHDKTNNGRLLNSSPLESLTISLQRIAVRTSGGRKGILGFRV